MVTKKNLNKKYEQRWYDYLCSKKFSIIYEYVCDHIIKNDSAAVLDVGCWDGMFYNVLKKSGYKDYYLGFDLCSTAIGVARKKYGNNHTEFMACDWNDQLVEGCFDAIYLGGVLYYIEDKVTFLETLIERHNPRIIAIQDLQETDLSCLNRKFKIIAEKKFYVDLETNEAKKNRQVKIFRIERVGEDGS